MSSSPTEQTAAPRDGAGSVDVVMPQMGVSVAEGTIASWLKQPGDSIAADEPICEVSTDKIDVEVPAPGDGVVDELAVEEGETVAVGTVIARIRPAGASGGEERERRPAAEPAGAEDSPDAAAAAEAEPEEHDRSQFYSPVVRRIAAEKGIDLSRVEGHGVGGRIRKADLLAHISAEEGGGNGHGRPLHTESPYRPEPEPAPAAEAPVEPEPDREAARPAVLDELSGPTRSEPMDPMRKAIARHMVESRRTSAHCTTVVEADFSAVVRDRGEQKEAMKRRGVSLTYLAFVARATVEALQEHPVLNASLEGDRIVYHEDVNLGIAVALESGLVAPVIRRAQRLSLEGMAAEISELAARAREGTLEPDDLAGGTFTITNPGQFGAVMATPIINQPQVAILDLEAVVRRPVVVDGPEGESIGIRPMSYLCMSWDHRALDGAVAARFLSTIRARLEQGGLR